MREPPSDFRVTLIASRPAPPVHATISPPRAPWSFAVWIAAGAAVALLAGLVLGILAALEAGIGGDRWSQSVQAHGRLQLFGFVGTFVVALAFEFLPRINQRRAFPLALRAGVPALIGAGSILLAVAQVWHGTLGALAWPGGALLMAGVVAFAVAVARVAPHFPLHQNPQPLYPRAGAAWLVIAAAFLVTGAVQAEAGVVPLDTSRVTVEAFLRGFVMLFIAGIALRAFVGHLDRQPMAPARQVVLFALFNASLAAWLLAQGLGPLPAWGWLARLADAGYAAAALAFSVWVAPRIPLRAIGADPQYAWMIPVAWLGLLAFAALLLWRAVLGDPSPGLYEDGALRHLFMLGFMVPLMVAMSDVVLARFGIGVIPRERLLVASFVLLVVAWPLRVLPVLFSDSPSTLGERLMATAGGLTMVALLLLAAVCVGVATAQRRMLAARAALHR